MFPDDWPDADREFMDSFTPAGGGVRIPDGSIANALIAVCSWIDPVTGAEHWLSYALADIPISQTVGLLEMAKLDLLATTPGAVTSLSQPREEDDE